ncbi:hypothetical protein LB505_002900 [Fusarium chuoi]|nr:hypothetical protein LB505_002900 [Fusarium chuoi]
MHNDEDESAIDDDDASTGSPTIGEDSPTKHGIAHNAGHEDEHKNDAEERKRKRSPSADQSETEQPLRKRASSEHATDRLFCKKTGPPLHLKAPVHIHLLKTLMFLPRRDLPTETLIWQSVFRAP